MPWCVPGRAFVLGTALNMLHPVILTPLGVCDHARPRTFVTRGWGFAASPVVSGFYSLYSRMPTCSATLFALCKFCMNLVMSSTVKLMPSPRINTSGSQRLTSGIHTLEATTRTLYTRPGSCLWVVRKPPSHPFLYEDCEDPCRWDGAEVVHVPPETRMEHEAPGPLRSRSRWRCPLWCTLWNCCAVS